jgi:regulator of sigma D
MHCLADFKEVTDFCKSMIAYKHTTPFTVLERVLTDGASSQPPAVGENYIF